MKGWVALALLLTAASAVGFTETWTATAAGTFIDTNSTATFSFSVPSDTIVLSAKLWATSNGTLTAQRTYSDFDYSAAIACGGSYDTNGNPNPFYICSSWTPVQCGWNSQQYVRYYTTYDSGTYSGTSYNCGNRGSYGFNCRCYLDTASYLYPNLTLKNSTGTVATVPVNNSGIPIEIVALNLVSVNSLEVSGANITIGNIELALQRTRTGPDAETCEFGTLYKIISFADGANVTGVLPTDLATTGLSGNYTYNSTTGEFTGTNITGAIRHVGGTCALPVSFNPSGGGGGGGGGGFFVAPQPVKPKPVVTLSTGRLTVDEGGVATFRINAINATNITVNSTGAVCNGLVCVVGDNVTQVTLTVNADGEKFTFTLPVSVVIRKQNPVLETVTTELMQLNLVGDCPAADDLRLKLELAKDDVVRQRLTGDVNVDEIQRLINETENFKCPTTGLGGGAIVPEQPSANWIDAIINFLKRLFGL